MYYDRVKAYFYRDSGTTQIMLGICMLSMPGLYRFAFDLCQTGKENEGFSCERPEYGLCWMKAQENSTRKSARDC
jgi:hypothetical protein